MSHRIHESWHNGAFGSAVGAFVIALLGAKLLWAWLVPVLVPGAVAQGMVAASLPWASAALIAAAIAAAMFLMRHSRRHAHGEGRATTRA